MVFSVGVLGTVRCRPWHLDRLLLTTDANLTPSGNGPAESPRIDVSGGNLTNQLPIPDVVATPELGETVELN